MRRQYRWYADDMVADQALITDQAVIAAVHHWAAIVLLEYAADKLLTVMSIEVAI